MSEIIQRKERMDAAIASCDPSHFAQNLLAWLEATVYVRVLPNLQKLGLQPGAIPELTEVDLRELSIRTDADDTVMAFCIASALNRDAKAFAELDRLLTVRFGPIYPGSSALYHCNQKIDPIVTLDDAVGQIIKALLEGEALEPKEIWNAGLRFLQRIRSSNFVRELAPLLARFLRAEWSAALNREVSELVDSEKSTARIRLALADPIEDQAFVAALLFASMDAIEMNLDPEYRRQLAAIAHRP
jgi:hypothetical protein